MKEGYIINHCEKNIFGNLLFFLFLDGKLIPSTMR